MLIIADAKIVMRNSETSLAEAISAHGITHVSKAATQFMQVMDKKSPSACLRTVIVEGEGAMPRSIIGERCQQGRTDSHNFMA